MATTNALDALQSDEQRRVLELFNSSEVAACLVQKHMLVVCGDQSAGKGSVLEAITEIPFPREDNLCTRFATEINLRRGPVDSLTLRLIPDATRPAAEQERIRSFKATITDFGQLPKVMAKAMEAMEMKELGKGRAFTRNVLSIDIEGPTRPQLSLVDLPGLIQNESKGVSVADVKLVEAITDRYISQARTICLAVISATNDYSNQGIITKVRKADQDGKRTLGIITKPDQLDHGSKAEKAYIELASNNDIFFKLGWHVLKNRKFGESHFTFEQRNSSEAEYFSTRNFKCLPKDKVGSKSLVVRLRDILFSHIKQELPKVQSELDADLGNTQNKLNLLGVSRSTPEECRSFLTRLSQECHNICKAAIDSFYEGQYFESDGHDLDPGSAPISRLRAKIYQANEDFVTNFRENAATYSIIDTTVGSSSELQANQDTDRAAPASSKKSRSKASNANASTRPIVLTREDALEKWVNNTLVRIRGRELSGNYNPLIVGYLFWEQSKKWETFAKDHIEDVATICRKFLNGLFKDKYPRDIEVRLWRELVSMVLDSRQHGAQDELDKLIKDNKKHPVNFNRSYTQTVSRDRLKRKWDEMNSTLNSCPGYHYSGEGQDGSRTLIPGTADIALVMERLNNIAHHGDKDDIHRHACEDTLDCVLAIYQVILENFTYNVVVQAVERHLVNDIEEIFSPVKVSQLSEKQILAIAKEPDETRQERMHQQNRLAKLQGAQKILRDAMSDSF